MAFTGKKLWKFRSRTNDQMVCAWRRVFKEFSPWCDSASRPFLALLRTIGFPHLLGTSYNEKRVTKNAFLSN